jgi:hypothetical protein
MSIGRISALRAVADDVLVLAKCHLDSERLHHRAHVQQSIGVGAERPCGRRVRTKDSREEISAFRAQGGARPEATAVPDSGAGCVEDRRCG